MSGHRPNQKPTKKQMFFYENKGENLMGRKKNLRGIINFTLKSAHGNHSSSTELVLLPVSQCIWHGSRYSQMSYKSNVRLLKI